MPSIEYKAGPEHIEVTCPEGQTLTGGGQLAKTLPFGDFLLPLRCHGCGMSCNVDYSEDKDGKKMVYGECYKIVKKTDGMGYFEIEL